MRTDWIPAETTNVAHYKRLLERERLYSLKEAALLQPPELDVLLSWQKQDAASPEWSLRYSPSGSYDDAIAFLAHSQKSRRSRTLNICLGAILVLGIITWQGFESYWDLENANSTLKRQKEELETKNKEIEDAKKQQGEELAIYTTSKKHQDLTNPLDLEDALNLHKQAKSPMASGVATDLVFSLIDAKELRPATGGRSLHGKAKLSPDGRWLATSGIDAGSGRVFNLQSDRDLEVALRLPFPLRRHSNNIVSLGFSLDGKCLATASAKRIYIWNLEKPDSEPAEIDWPNKEVAHEIWVSQPISDDSWEEPHRLVLVMDIANRLTAFSVSRNQSTTPRQFFDGEGRICGANIYTRGKRTDETSDSGKDGLYRWAWIGGEPVRDSTPLYESHTIEKWSITVDEKSAVVSVRPDDKNVNELVTLDILKEGPAIITGKLDAGGVIVDVACGEGWFAAVTPCPPNKETPSTLLVWDEMLQLRKLPLQNDYVRMHTNVDRTAIYTAGGGIVTRIDMQNTSVLANGSGSGTLESRKSEVPVGSGSEAYNVSQWKVLRGGKLHIFFDDKTKLKTVDYSASRIEWRFLNKLQPDWLISHGHIPDGANRDDDGVEFVKVAVPTEFRATDPWNSYSGKEIICKSGKVVILSDGELQIRELASNLSRPAYKHRLLADYEKISEAASIEETSSIKDVYVTPNGKWLAVRASHPTQAVRFQKEAVHPHPEPPLHRYELIDKGLANLAAFTSNEKFSEYFVSETGTVICGNNEKIFALREDGSSDVLIVWKEKIEGTPGEFRVSPDGTWLAIPILGNKKVGGVVFRIGEWGNVYKLPFENPFWLGQSRCVVGSKGSQLGFSLPDDFTKLRPIAKMAERLDKDKMERCAVHIDENTHIDDDKKTYWAAFPDGEHVALISSKNELATRRKFSVSPARVKDCAFEEKDGGVYLRVVTSDGSVLEWPVSLSAVRSRSAKQSD